MPVPNWPHCKKWFGQLIDLDIGADHEVVDELVETVNVDKPRLGELNVEKPVNVGAA
jgi:hypothetical protein